MTGSIYMAATGALAYQKRLEVLSNNLANVNTVGFKQDKSCFQTYCPSELSKNNLPKNSYSVVSQAPSFWIQVKTNTDLSSGPLKKTENRYDLGITGSGFFCVQTPQGLQYTRRGDFSINEEGLLATQEGWPVLGDGGEIVIESQADITDLDGHKFIVDEDGNVSVDGKIVDTLRIVDFQDAHRLEKVGDTFFAPSTPNIGETMATDFKISQGFVELSNVNAVKMMTELIEIIRGYESYQKVIRSIDDVNSKVINEVGKPL